MMACPASRVLSHPCSAEVGEMMCSTGNEQSRLVTKIPTAGILDRRLPVSIDYEPVRRFGHNAHGRTTTPLA